MMLMTILHKIMIQLDEQRRSLRLGTLPGITCVNWTSMTVADVLVVVIAENIIANHYVKCLCPRLTRAPSTASPFPPTTLRVLPGVTYTT